MRRGWLREAITYVKDSSVWELGVLFDPGCIVVFERARLKRFPVPGTMTSGHQSTRHKGLTDPSVCTNDKDTAFNHLEYPLIWWMIRSASWSMRV